MSDGVTTTQSKYQKKRKSESQPVIEANEVRIKGNQGHVKRYVDYACRLLLGAENYPSPRSHFKEAEDNANNDGDEDKKDEAEPNKKFDSIVLKATGRAINKAVTTAEVVKRRIGELHQVTTLETLEITDVWEPMEAGLKEVETKRRVASITIMLSRDESQVDKNAAGYQIPIAPDAIKPFFATQSRRGFRKFRGGRRGDNYNRNRNYRRGRGGGGYNNNRNFRGGFYDRNYGGGYNNNRNYRGGRGGYNRRDRGGGGGGGGSPNRSPGGGFNRRGGGGGGYRGGGRGGGFGGGGYQQRPRGRGGYNRGGNNNY